ncbi:MAG: DUF1679 domain-containing protein [Dehalococcoidia bacterium]|nr:DUF1679 domain-containing protein [Dehalococcoidia bacterium]
MPLTLQTGPVPLSAGGLTPAWLEAALGVAGIATVAAEPLGTGRGFVGQTFRVSYRLDGRRTAETVVVKLPAASARARASLAPLRYGEREAHFYTELAPSSSLATAQCHHAALDPATGDAVLVLQDLGDGDPGDDLEGCPPDQARRLVRQLGAYHARHWNAPSAARSWLPRFDQDQPDRYYDVLWRRMKHRHASVIPPAFIAIGDRLGAELAAFRARLATPPLTITHGDLRTDNLVFYPDRVVVLDWQVIAWARGPLDLGYFLTQSFAPDIRRAFEPELLAAYHRALVNGGVPGYQQEACRDDMRLGCLQNAATFVLAGGSLDFTGDRARELLQVTLERITAAVADWQPFDLLAGG